jgi:hypothetical protein
MGMIDACFCRHSRFVFGQTAGGADHVLQGHLDKADIAWVRDGVASLGWHGIAHSAANRWQSLLADCHEVRGASVDAGSVAKLGDLVNESDDEMGAKRPREPAERLHGRGMLSALDTRDRGVAGPHALRELGLAQLQLTTAAYNDPCQRLIRRESL